MHFSFGRSSLMFNVFFISSRNVTTSCFVPPCWTFWKQSQFFLNKVKISRELQMLSRSLLSVMIQASQFVSNSQLCHLVTNSLNQNKSKSLSLLIVVRTPGIVKGNNPSLVWFKWGSQWWGILKHFLYTYLSLVEKKEAEFFHNIDRGR